MKKIIIIIIFSLFITGCSCSRKKDNSEEKIKEITNVTLEAPMNDVYKIEIKNTEEKIYIKIGDSFDIISWITPNDAVDKNLKWINSNPNVVKLNKTGNVTGLKKGTAKINVKTKNKITSNTLVIEVIE